MCIMLHRTLGSSAVALFAFTLTALSQEAAYREVFPSIGEGGDTSLSGAGWKAHSGPGALDQTSSGAVSVSTDIGRAGGTPGLNSGVQGSAQGARGFLIGADQALTGLNMLYWTDEYSILTKDVKSFQWYLGNGSATDIMRVAVAVTDGEGATSWYASSDTFSSAAKTSPTFPSQSELKTLLMNNSLFNNLSFTPGSMLSLGGTAGLLPEGTITAFGLYSDAVSGAQRIDTFTINQVPEPSTVLLGLAGMIALGSWRRRPARRSSSS